MASIVSLNLGMWFSKLTTCWYRREKKTKQKWAGLNEIMEQILSITCTRSLVSTVTLYFIPIFSSCLTLFFNIKNLPFLCVIVWLCHLKAKSEKNYIFRFIWALSTLVNIHPSLFLKYTINWCSRLIFYNFFFLPLMELFLHNTPDPKGWWIFLSVQHRMWRMGLLRVSRRICFSS